MLDLEGDNSVGSLERVRSEYLLDDDEMSALSLENESSIVVDVGKKSSKSGSKKEKKKKKKNHPELESLAGSSITSIVSPTLQSFATGSLATDSLATGAPSIAK
jgi:hypothetical protein